MSIYKTASFAQTLNSRSPDLTPDIFSSWTDENSSENKKICLQYKNKPVGGSKQWAFVDGQFNEKVLKSKQGRDVVGLQVKEVFGSSSQHTCPPKYMQRLMFFSFFPNSEAAETLPKMSDENCKHMHEFFKLTGTPSYIEPIEGFSLDL